MRAISFPLLLGLFFAMIFWEDGGRYLFACGGAALSFGLAFDCCSMLKKIGVTSYRGATSALLGLFFLSSVAMEWKFIAILALLLLAAAWFYCWTMLLWSKDKAATFRRGVGSAGIFLLLLVMIMPLYLIYDISPILFLFMVLTTKAMDTGGYIAGVLSGRWMKNGNHKIFPKISPKKSYEGVAGGITLSVVTALIFFYCDALPGMPLGACLAIAVILALGSFAGDLTESALKRTCEVKDSGNYIPGMGGAFDVVDSFIYNGILFLATGTLLKCL